MNLNDLYIQKRIQGGDIGEFEKLFKRYYEPLCHHAFRFLKDMDASEDIVQEFFYNFWKNRESFKIHLSLNAYLYQSVHNNSLNYLRHLAVKEDYTEQVRMDSVEGTQADGESLIEMKELDAIVRITFEQLPERCSRVFRMNRFEGKKYREIAEILSISVKTVESDMGKALQIFRVALKEFRQVSREKFIKREV